jgi:hypothetical protein
MRMIIFLALLCPAIALGQTITANGNYQDQNCRSGEGRVEVYDGGGGYDSGVVTFQYYSSASEAWENACPTAADCQWSSGDSGAVPFDLGTGAQVRLNVASVASSADIDLDIRCSR